MMQFLVKKHLARLRRIIEQIRSRDLTLHFSSDKLRGEEKRLVEELNGVVSDFRSDIARQETLYETYEAMLDQVDEALLAVDKSGRVKWMNRKAIDSLCGFKIDSLDKLNALHPDLPAALDSLHPGEQKLLGINIDGNDSQMKISMVKYTRDGAESRLFSIENIQSIVQESEIDAQRKLVSVLTHEIMNSLTPIISLSDTLCRQKGNIDDDTLMALQAINRRSQGLLTFVENYRKLSRLSRPQLAWVHIGSLIRGLGNLLPSPNIVYDIEDDDIELQLDRNQIEQLLINLLKNSVESCQTTDNPTIRLSTHADHANRRFHISVFDNGSGIAPETLERIFVPFFTTKPNGSGIGLSISRQIVAMHGGIIKVKSAPGATTFDIQFPLNYRIAGS